MARLQVIYARLQDAREAEQDGEAQALGLEVQGDFVEVQLGVSICRRKQEFVEGGMGLKNAS